jgi:hypothetical protein
MSSTIKLQNVRLFFNDLLTPVQFEGKGEYKYGAIFGVLKTDKKQIKMVEDAIKTEAAEVYKAKADKVLANIKGSKQQYCWHDGDNVEWEGAEGCMILSAKRKQKDGSPNLRDQSNNLITSDNGVLYSGCYVNAKVDIWAQAGEHQGIRCGLTGIQKYADGDSFSGASKPKDDDFDVIDTPEGEDTMA